MNHTALLRKSGLPFIALLIFSLNAQCQDFAKFFVFGPANPFAGTTFISSHELSDSSGFVLLGDRLTSNYRNGFIIKTDPALNEVWTTSLNFQNAQAPYDSITFFDIGELMNGNIYAYGVAGPGGTSPHYVLFVLSPSGQVLNHIALHDTLNNTNVANMTSVELARDSTVIIPVSEYERYGYYRLDQNLNLLSFAFYSDTTTAYSTGRDCILLNDSNLLMNTQIGLTKTDLAGNVLWARKYTNLVRTYSVMESASGSIYVSTFTSISPTNAALAKFDSNGNPVFVKTYNMSPGTATSPAWKIYEHGNDLMIYSDSVMFRTDTNGNVIGMGKTVDAYNNKIMRPALDHKFTITGQIMQDSVSSYQYTLMRFDDSTQMGCLHPRTVVMTPSSTPQYAAVAVRQPAIIERDTINFFAVSVNLDFDAVNGCPANPLSVTSVEEENPIRVYPNPANSEINFENLARGATITIVNAIGETVFVQNSENASLTINTSFWSEGLYFVMVSTMNDSHALMFAVTH
jgi:hypothetical protein